MPRMKDPLPTQDDLRALAKRLPPVVSLLVPVTASIPERSQNRVRLERAVRSGLERLRRLDLDASTLADAERDLADFVESSGSAGPSNEARAAFWSKEEGARFLGLPVSCEETVKVADTAALRPIAQAVRRPNRYRVLVLSGKRIELLEGDARGLERRTDTDLPASLEDALGQRVEGTGLQFHSTDGRGGRAVFHGHEDASAGRENDQERLHQHVARALEDILIEQEPVPLVLAAETRHRPFLKAALRRDIGLLEKGLEGNPDHLSAAALHEQAWPLVASAVPSARSELERIRETGSELVLQVSDLMQHAVMGRIARLWAPEHGRIPGRLDLEKGAMAPARSEDDDLIDDLVAEVIRRGGEVFVLDGESLDDEMASLAAEIR